MTFTRTMAAIAGLLTTILAGATLSATHAFAQGSPIVGHVYVNGNTAGINTIAGFNRHANGSLTPISGSPFTIGGAGTGAPLGSQGAIQFAARGRFLIAVNAASNSVSVAPVLKNGAVGRPTDTVYSGGKQPVSIAVHRSLVYVANSGGTAANYTGFRLVRGRLTPLTGSTYSLPAGTVVGDVLFNATGTHLAATRVDTPTLPSEIDSFSVNSAGFLTPAPGSPFAAQSVGPFGSQFRPTNPNQLFVSNAHAGANNGTVSAFTVSANGTLNSIAGSPFADNQTAPCWVTITPNGKYLFAVNTAVPSVSSFSIAPGGALSLIGSVPMSHSSALSPFDIKTDPSGKYAYVTDAASGQISVFSNSGGTLTELSGSPVSVPAGSAPFGMAVS